ncbi:galectin-6-like [Clarias gariepinus]|uniref:galectin-6-like n=1 Tax=Clarias gariepinus TaxID=13013 RepID=UPI00234DBC9E|nr:galectin-6-like [Clarias gariepinus]
MGSGSTSFIPLEVRDPISKPAVPYIGEIPGSVKQDMAIVFQGTVPVDATSFEINFMTGPTENDDIAFQYNPRIGDVTALNSKRNGSWETQESACHNPFTRGGAFIILAVINSEGYQVYVNGIKHCTFTHRLPLEKVSNINIRGNISLLVWGLIDSWSTTASSTELKKITSTWTSTSISTTSPFEISNPVSKPALPYVGTIQGGLKPDTAIFLQGTVPADGKNFEINFKTGPTEADDIAFHYKPIFGDCTALNSKRNGSWETQQNESDKPFTKGGSFQIFIAVKPDAYDVYVNGSKHCTFKHRLPLEKVSTLNFKGDVSLFIYGLIQKWTSPFVSIKEKKTLLMGSGSTSFIPLQVRDPISKPAVPYIGEIPGSVKQDMAIVFQGTVPVDATSFEINFMTGPTENDDIAFQYNPRIGDCTALNKLEHNCILHRAEENHKHMDLNFDIDNLSF